MWDLRERNKSKCVTSLAVGDTVSALKVSHDGNWLAVGGANHGKGIISLSHVASREITNSCEWNQGEGRVQCLEYTEGNLVVGGNSRIVEYWNRNATEHVVDVVTSNASVLSLGYDSIGDSGILCVGGSSTNINVFSDDRNHMMCLSG